MQRAACNHRLLLSLNSRDFPFRFSRRSITQSVAWTGSKFRKPRLTHVWNCVDAKSRILSKAEKAKQKSDSDDLESKAKDEIRATIDALPREEIYLPAASVNLSTLTPEIIMDEDQSNQMLLLPQFTQSVRDHYRLPSQIREQFKTFDRMALLYRPCMHSLIQELQKQSGSRYILHGVKGCGKTAMLLFLASHFTNQRHFVVYMPRVTTWINGSTRFAYDASTQLYEQPEATQQFLQFLLKWNQTLLQDKPVALRQPKTIGMTEVKDLQGLLQLGAKEQRSATAVFEVLVQELPHLPLKTAVFLDMLNGFFNQPSKYRDTESRTLVASQFKLVRYLSDLATGDRPLVNGLVVGATTSRVMVESAEAPLETVQEACTGLKVATVPPFDLKEADELVRYYARCRLLGPGRFLSEEMNSVDEMIDEASPAFVREAHFVAEGRGDELFDFCVSKSFL